MRRPYIALTMGIAWASGINLYAFILVLGLLGATGNMALPENLTRYSVFLADPSEETATKAGFVLEMGMA